MATEADQTIAVIGAGAMGRGIVQPMAGPVARVSCDSLQSFQYLHHPVRAKTVSQGQGASRIAQANANSVVNVVYRGNTPLGDIGADVHNGGQHTLNHKTGAVIDNGIGGVVCSQYGGRIIPRLGTGNGA